MKNEKTNTSAKSIKAIIITFLVLTFAGMSLAQTTYRIKVKATGTYLHENGWGDKFLSTRFQPNDDFTRFILYRQSDGSYRIRVKANGRYLHEDGTNDRLVSTRYQPNDDFTKFFLIRQGDGSFRIRVKANGRYLHHDGGGDKLLSTRYQPNDDFTRFYFERVRPVYPRPTGPRKVMVTFNNRTQLPVSVYWVDFQGRERLYKNMNRYSLFRQPTFVRHQWRVRLNGKLVGSYYANGSFRQTVNIVIRNINAGPIWNQTDANRKCNNLARSRRGVWTGAWWTTVQNRMSVCSIVSLY